MLTYPCEERGKLPLYDYLYRCIREDILAGRLTAGERLPSKRALAQHLKVSVITVENAYAQLSAEGYVVAKEKRGYFVAGQMTQLPFLSTPSAPMWEENPEPPCALDLASNSIRPEAFPFSVWAKLTRETLTEEGAALLSRTPYNGAPALRQAIAEHLHRYRGMEVHPEQIVVTAGTEMAYMLLAQLLGRDRIYAVENPGYHKIMQVYRQSDVACRPVPLDAEGISMQALEESGASVVHLSPAHHFPTGTVTSASRRQQLLRWAEAGDRLIIEDDYDSEFRMVGRPIPPLQSLDRRDRVIMLNTFSKSMAPSIRISYMVLPPPLAVRYRETMSMYACAVPAQEQLTLAKFLHTGAFERHLRRLRTLYRGLRDGAIEAVKASPLGETAVIREADAGLHFLLHLDTERSDRELREKAAAAGIRLAFLSDYAYPQGSGEPHWLVVNYSGLDLDHLPQGLQQLSEWL